MLGRLLCEQLQAQRPGRRPQFWPARRRCAGQDHQHQEKTCPPDASGCERTSVARCGLERHPQERNELRREQHSARSSQQPSRAARSAKTAWKQARSFARAAVRNRNKRQPSQQLLATAPLLKAYSAALTALCAIAVSLSASAAWPRPREVMLHTAGHGVASSTIAPRQQRTATPCPSAARWQSHLSNTLLHEPRDGAGQALRACDLTRSHNACDRLPE